MLYNISCGEVNYIRSEKNNGTLRKLIKNATAWLSHLPKQMLQSRKSRPKVE